MEGQGDDRVFESRHTHAVGLCYVPYSHLTPEQKNMNKLINNNNNI